MLDKKTQDTHRKLLEQIKQDKERKKSKYLEKYQKKLIGYQVQLKYPGTQQQDQSLSQQDQEALSQELSKVNQEIEVDTALQEGIIYKKANRSRSRSHENCQRREGSENEHD